MKLKLLDKPFSLTSRALSLGLACHHHDGCLTTPVVASYDTTRLLAFQSRNPDLDATYVWVVLDGFYLLSEHFRRISLKPEFSAMRLFAVGDCGGLADLRVASANADLKLLLGSERLKETARNYCKANPIRRLRHHIPPSLFYESWDYLKDFNHSTKYAEGCLFFAGNDGLRGIGAVFVAIDAVDRLDEPGMDSKVFVEIVATALSMDLPLDRIAVRILDYYNRLCHEIDLRLRPGFASQDERVLYHRNRCCKAVLFKSLFRYLVLSWLKSKNLAIVITSPRRNQSFYAHRRLNKLLMLDFGGINGFEEIYPRSLDCMLYGKQVVSLNDLSRRMYECLCNADLSRYKLLSELIEPSLRDSLAEP